MINSRYTSVLAGSLLALGLTTPAVAQDNKPDDYPTKPIELVVPYGAGGGNDLTARAISSVAPDYLGTSLIVRIRPGAGSVTGLAEVARGRADGYTLALPGPHSLTIGAFRDIPINLLEDFEPIVGVSDWPFMMLVPGDSPFDTFEDFLTFAQENPGEVTIGNTGALAIGHLPALLLESQAGVELTHVPFDGGGPLYQGLLTGSVDVGMGVPPWGVPAVQDGQLKLLAVAGDERMEELPDVPTFEELGYDISVNLMVTVMAPKGIPEDRLEFLRSAFAELVQDPTYQRLINRLGDKVVFRDSEELRSALVAVAEKSQETADRLKAAGVVE